MENERMSTDYTDINKNEVWDLLEDEEIMNEAIGKAFNDSEDTDDLKGDVVYEICDILEDSPIYRQKTMDGSLVGANFKKRVIKALIGEIEGR